MGLRSGLAGLARKRPDAVKFTLDASIANRKFEFKVQFAAFIGAFPDVLKLVEEQIYTRLREGAAGYSQHPGPAGDGAAGWTAPEQAGIVPPRPPLRLIGQNCTIVRTDVVAFGAAARDDQDRRIIRQADSEMTRLALEPVWDSCRWEDRGDGLLIAVSPDVPTARVIDRLVAVLPQELRRHNRFHSAPVRIQLRVAVEVGPVGENGIGMAGHSIIRASRMLDAPAFRQAIAGHGALLGLVVSPFVYENYIENGDGVLGPEDYIRVPVQAKETRELAWMHLAGTVSAAREPLMHPAGKSGALAA